LQGIATARSDDVPPVGDEPASKSCDFDLDEFVVDYDDYPEVAARRRTPTAPATEPDRIDDVDDVAHIDDVANIDEWLAEFAVEDCWDASSR
jgi:hypothetical protein